MLYQLLQLIMLLLHILMQMRHGREKLGLLLQLIPKKELLKTMVLKLRLDIWKSLIIQLLYRLLFQKRDIHGLDGRLQNQMVMYIT